MTRFALQAPVAVATQLVQDAQILALETDIKAKGRNLGTFDSAAPPGGLPSITAKDFFYNTADGNSLYYAAADGDAITAFTKLAVAPTVTLATDPEFTTGTEATKPPSVKQVVDADALKIDKAAIQTTIRDAATSTDTDVASEKAIRTALDSLSGDFVGLTDTPNDLTGLALQIMRVNAAEDAIEAVTLAASLVAFDNATANLAGAPATSQAAIEALKALLDGQPTQVTAADFPSLPSPVTIPEASIYHVIDASGDPTITAGWSKYQVIGGVWYKYLSLEDLQGVVELTQAEIESTTGADYTKFGTVSTERLDQWAVARELYADSEIDVTADDTPLEFGKSYRVVSNSVTLPVPSAANKGKMIFVRNANTVKSGVYVSASGANVKLNSNGAIIPVPSTPPATRTILVSNGSEYELALSEPRGVVSLNATDDGAGLVPSGRYTIDVPAGGMTVKLPALIAGYIDVMIGQTSTGTLRLEMEDATANISYFDSSGVLRVDTFYDVDAAAYKGQLIRIFADGSTGRWGFEKLQSDVPTPTILEKIIVGVSSAGTDAGSAIAFTINDKDGNPYPNSDWRVTSQWSQTSGTADNVAYTNQALPTSLTVGRNKNGTVELVYVGQSPNGTASITATPSNGAAAGDVKFKFEGSNDTTDFADVASVANVDWTIDVQQVPQVVLPDWEGAQDYTVSETKVVGIAPIGVTPQVEGTAYILRPKADLTSAAALDATEWALYDVLGEYKLNGTTVRSVTDTGIESLLFFDINAGTEGNIRVIPSGVTKTFRLSGIADANFALDDNTTGQVTATGGTSQDVTVTGPATLYHTLDGTTHKISVFGTIVPVQRKEQTYFAHTLPDPTNGIHAIDGTDIDDVDFAAWITANPITGFSVAGSVVSCPDWRGRYLGASGGLGINTTAGQTYVSANKSHNHTSGAITFNGSGAAYGTRTVSSKNSSNWDNFGNTNQSPITSSSGSTYARPETVGLPLCVIIGATRQYIPIEEAMEITNAATAPAGTYQIRKNADGTFDLI